MSEVKKYYPYVKSTINNNGESIDAEMVPVPNSYATPNELYVKYSDHLSQITALNQTITELREGLMKIHGMTPCFDAKATRSEEIHKIAHDLLAKTKPSTAIVGSER